MGTLSKIGVGYARVSGKEQAANGTSLDSQVEQIRAYAAMKGIELVSVFVEPAVVGDIPLAARPEGRKAVALLDERRCGCVIIAKLDRAFRNTIDCLQTVESWDRRGYGLHVVNLGGASVDTRSPSGRFMLTVMAAVAEMERGMIQERTAEGRRKRRLQGKRIGSVPFGYSLGPNNALVPIRKQQETLGIILRLRDQGRAYHVIAAYLNDRRMLSQAGGSWYASNVKSVIMTYRKAVEGGLPAHGHRGKKGDERMSE